MVVYGFVGTYRDERDISIRGNGKTLTMSYYLWDAHTNQQRTIFTNYRTSFSTEKLSQEIVEEIVSGEFPYKNIALGFDEISKTYNRWTKGSILELFDETQSQSRKFNCDIYWSAQRFKNVNNLIRAHTDTIIKPRKYHRTDNSFCNRDNCLHDHYILVFCVDPYVPYPLRRLNAWKFSNIYDSRQYIRDKSK